MKGGKDLLGAFVVARLFVAVFLVVFGIGWMAKTESEMALVLGAVSAAIGLTFFIVLWMRIRLAERNG